jgi:hypothetical protein
MEIDLREHKIMQEVQAKLVAVASWTGIGKYVSGI